LAPAGHPDRRVFANLIVRKNDLGGAIRSAVAEEQFPPGAGRGAPGLHPSHGPFSSWYVHILPFMEEDAIWQQIDFVNLPPEPVIGDVPWSVGNTVLSTGKKLNATTVDWALCPSDEFTPHVADTTRGQMAAANYAGNRGVMAMSAHGGCQQFSRQLVPRLYVTNLGPFGRLANSYANCNDSASCSGIMGDSGYGAKLTEVRDGTSNTLAISEILPECRDEAAYPFISMWEYAGHVNTTFANAPPNLDTCPPNGQGPCDDIGNWPASRAFKSKHPGGINAALCDGSVRFISDGIDLETYHRLGERADELVLGDF